MIEVSGGSEAELRTGAWLRALSAHGGVAGSAILYQGRQTPDLPHLAAAIWALGAILVPIDAAWPDFMIERTAGRLDPAVVVAPPDRLPALHALFPAAAAIAIDAPLGEAGDAPATVVGLDAPAAYLFTSGSTGTPKAVVHRRGGLLAGARTTLDTFGWQAGERLVNLPEPHTMSGLRNALVAAPMGGLDWIAMPDEASANIFALCAWLVEARPHRLVCGPALLRQLALMDGRLPDGIFYGLRAIYCTGAALNPQLAAAFHARHGVPVVN